MKRSLINAQVSCDHEKVNEVSGLMKKLRASFLEVSRQDTSEPLMKNTEKVYSGLTYSRYGAYIWGMTLFLLQGVKAVIHLDSDITRSFYCK